MRLLSIAEVEKALEQLPGWHFELDRIAKTFKFQSPELAQAHKKIVEEIFLKFEREANANLAGTSVYVDVCNPDYGGITEKDIVIAEEIEKI